ncbi:GntR family transcriptional regulator [Methylobacterium sp. JK268]
MAPLQVLERFSTASVPGPIGLAITAFLRTAIVRNQLVPGQALPEAELAQIMGVSRQPVREALIRLSEMGLLRILPQRGTLVTRISVAGVLSGRFIRQAAERAVIVEAARQASDAEIRAMWRLVERQEDALAQQDSAALLALDDDLHETFARSMGITSVWPGLTAAKLQMDRVRHLSTPLVTPGERIIAQHRAIVAAVAARDAAAADAAMAGHLTEVLASLPELIARMPEHFDQGEGD